MLADWAWTQATDRYTLPSKPSAGNALIPDVGTPSSNQDGICVDGGVADNSVT